MITWNDSSTKKPPQDLSRLALIVQALHRLSTYSMPTLFKLSRLRSAAVLSLRHASSLQSRSPREVIRVNPPCDATTDFAAVRTSIAVHRRTRSSETCALGGVSLSSHDLGNILTRKRVQSLSPHSAFGRGRVRTDTTSFPSAEFSPSCFLR